MRRSRKTPLTSFWMFLIFFPFLLHHNSCADCVFQSKQRQTYVKGCLGAEALFNQEFYEKIGTKMADRLNCGSCEHLTVDYGSYTSLSADAQTGVAWERVHPIEFSNPLSQHANSGARLGWRCGSGQRIARKDRNNAVVMSVRWLLTCT